MESPLWQQNLLFETDDFIVFHNGCGEIFVQTKGESGKRVEVRISVQSKENVKISTFGGGELSFPVGKKEVLLKAR